MAAQQLLVAVVDIDAEDVLVAWAAGNGDASGSVVGDTSSLRNDASLELSGCEVAQLEVCHAVRHIGESWDSMRGRRVEERESEIDQRVGGVL
jgi:hypothetical protein